MANSTNSNILWDDFLDSSASTTLSASLPPSTQTLDHFSLSDIGDSASGQNWFSSTGKNPARLGTIAEEDILRRTGAQGSPSKTRSDQPPSRVRDGYVSRTEFNTELRKLKSLILSMQAAVEAAQTTVQMVSKDNKKLTNWSIEADASLHRVMELLAEQNGERLVEGNWHVPEESQL